MSNNNVPTTKNTDETTWITVPRTIPYIDKNYYLKANSDNFSEIKIPDIPVSVSNVIYLEASVTAVNFINNIRTLKKDDYIEINGIRYISGTERKGTSAIAWSELLSDIISDSNVSVSVTPTDLIKFSSDDTFTISSMSYNIKMLCGFLDDASKSSILEDASHVIISPSHGNYNSTPIFFLLSNIGKNGYVQNEAGEIKSYNIFMKINNSSNATIPVVHSGGDHKQRLLLTDIAGETTFTLTDANLKILDLLYPVSITLRIRFVF